MYVSFLVLEFGSICARGESVSGILKVSSKDDADAVLK